MLATPWGGGRFVTAPCTPARQGGCAPWTPLEFVEAVDMGLSLRGFFAPAGQKDPLWGSVSLLPRYARSGVSLRAMPRPAGLSRWSLFGKIPVGALERLCHPVRVKCWPFFI